MGWRWVLRSHGEGEEERVVQHHCLPCCALCTSRARHVLLFAHYVYDVCLVYAVWVSSRACHVCVLSRVCATYMSCLVYITCVFCLMYMCMYAVLCAAYVHATYMPCACHVWPSAICAPWEA